MATSIPPTQTTRAGGANIIPGDDDFDASAGPGPEVMDAATLIGDKVVNAQGEGLGEIEAIMLDVRSGRIAYAVLSFGGFLGLGSKLFVPYWEDPLRGTADARTTAGSYRERPIESLGGLDRE